MRHDHPTDAYTISKPSTERVRTHCNAQQFVPRDRYEVTNDSNRVRDTRLVPQYMHISRTPMLSNTESAQCASSKLPSAPSVDPTVIRKRKRATFTGSDNKTAKIHLFLLTYLSRGSHKKFTFSGDPLEFQVSKMNYTHNTRDVETAVEKFEYLYSIVTGDAEKLCKKFCSHSDPDDALIKLWKTYERRYGTVKLSVDSLLHEISQKAVVELSASGLRTLLDDVTACEAEAIMAKPESFFGYFCDEIAI